MPDPYWEKIGETIREARKGDQTPKHVLKSRHKKRVKRLLRRRVAKINKRRWPCGAWEVRVALEYLRIYHIREFLIPREGGSFFQVDFALVKDKVFLEIDDPSHDSRKARDAMREQEILYQKMYEGWKFIRIKSEDCQDRMHLYCVLGKYATNLHFLTQ